MKENHNPNGIKFPSQKHQVMSNPTLKPFIPQKTPSGPKKHPKPLPNPNFAA